MAQTFQGTWNKDVSNIIDNNNNFIKFCNKLDSDANITNQSSSFSYSSNAGYISKPYGPSSCNKYAVLRKPPINQLIMNFCDTNGICKKSSFCNSDKCDYNVPGGLVDPRTNMDIYPNFKNYIRNGFIPDSCECQLGTQLKNKCIDFYNSYGENTINQNLNLCTSTICDNVYKENLKYKETGTFPSIGGFNKNIELSGDVSGTNENCKISYTDSKDSRSNCSLYIEKWAKTCKFCKDNSNITLSSPDTNYICKSDSDCYGKCLNGKCTTGEYKLDCNICNSDLWKYVPGGWEAIVDENNPLHVPAKLSYVSKTQKLTKKNQRDLKNYMPKAFVGTGFPDDDISNLSPYIIPDEEIINPKPDTDNANYCDQGPVIIEDWTLGNAYFTCNINDLEKITTLRKRDLSVNTGSDTITNNNNLCKNICSTDTISEWSDTNNLDTVWKNYSNNPDISKLSEDNRSCNVKYINYLSGDPLHDKYPLQSKIICQRNPQLTGQGLWDYNPDKPTQSNYHIAMNWVTGYLDLSDYGLSRQKYYTEEQTKNNFLEALRCCNGVSENPDDCMPASTCPSNKFCKDIHKAIPNLPDYDANYFGNNIQWDPKTSKHPEDYLKMYCEFISKNVKNDSEMIPFCRKIMYDYALEPVEVTINNQNYKLPLRIFDDSVKSWCNWDKVPNEGNLEKSLPDQEGICDMMLGKACQKLHVDGWINTDGSGPLLNLSSNGSWTETSGTKHPRGITQESIRNVCGCFMLGSECGSENCSYSYCGAGENCYGLTKDQCETSKCTWDNVFNKCTPPSELNTKIDIGNKTLPIWTSNFDKNNFSCKDGSCYSNCNYVNTYDVCWNAGPNDRLVTIPRNLNVWNCKDGRCTGPDACVGECPVNELGQPNCGTNSWFENLCNDVKTEGECNDLVQCKWDNGSCQTKLLDRAPNEGGYKNVSNWAKWQNSYVENAALKLSFPGMMDDAITFGTQEGTFKLCNSVCNKSSIKPYKKKEGCGTVCNSIQNISNANYGKLNNVNINMTNKEYIDCGIKKLNSYAMDDEVRIKFLNYMGDINNCTLIKGDSKNCDNAKICINTGTGNNCADCKNEKSHMCCTSSDLFDKTKNMMCFAKNPFNKGDVEVCSKFITEGDCNSVKYECKWLSQEVGESVKIANTIGSNKVTYICQETCPIGTKYIHDLLNDEKCKNCDEYRTMDDCNTCKYCSWNNNVCSPMCPKQSMDLNIYNTEKIPQIPEVVIQKITDKLPIIIGASVGAFVLLLIIGIVIWWKFFRKVPEVPGK